MTQQNDPRVAPFERLRHLIPLQGHDAESKAERLLLHRADLKERVLR